VSAFQLWEKGMFSLEDKLSKYFPEYEHMMIKTENGLVPAKNPIIIQHLFQMTSGMSYDLWTPELKAYYEESGRTCPTLEMVRRMAKTPLLFEPGTSWFYSLSHDVLAGLVELLSGQKFEDYVKEHIFDPLGMENSNFLHPMKDWEGFARQYWYKEDTKTFDPWWRNFYRPGNEYASGGAGCVSTVEDFIKFLEALRFDGKLLKKETIDLMCTDRLNEEQKKTFWNASTHGYGLGIRCPNGHPKRTDFGWGGAASAWLAVDPVNRLSLYFGTHMLSSPVAGIRSSLYSFVRAELLGTEEDFVWIAEDLKKLHNYNLTY
jgi:CubicO group peptidase (beta-lactamase class C family)